MKKHEKSNQFAYSLLIATLLSPLFITSAYGSSAGYAGALDCNACHSGGSGTASVVISGPTEVTRNSTHSFTVTITGGPAMTGGFRLAADAGLLILTDTDTVFLSDDIVQSTPRSFSGGSVSWSFDWTAPDVLGMVNMMVEGISADGTGGTGLDSYDFSAFTVQVVPIPAGLVLFTSCLAVLGWMRRRPAI